MLPRLPRGALLEPRRGWRNVGIPGLAGSCALAGLAIALAPSAASAPYLERVPQAQPHIPAAAPRGWSVSGEDVTPLAPFERVKVAGQVATRALANLPTQAEAGAVMGTSFVEVSGYYVSQKVAAAGALPGLKSRIVGEYVGRTGDGFLGVTMADYGSSGAAVKAMRAEAREVEITLKQVAEDLPGPGAWAGFDYWAGTNATGDTGIAVAIAGPVLIRMTISPAKGPWSTAQWDRAWGEALALQRRMMGAGSNLTLPPYLAGLVPLAAPPRLNPITIGTRSRDGWLPYGKPSPGLYQSMRPVNLSLQYAIVGAAPQLLLRVIVAPTSKPVLAQEYIASLKADPSSIGEFRIDDLPTGAVTVAYQGETGIDALETQFVGDGALIDISCSGITLAPAIQPALDACVSATQGLSAMFDN